MAAPIHPSELAYAFSYAGVTDIIGWGSQPFLPRAEDDAATWLTGGEDRMQEAGRLVGDVTTGLNFTDDMTASILALVDPTLVLHAERRQGDGVMRMTVHGAGTTFAGLSRQADGAFSLTRYGDITAAAVACAGFLGASLDPVEDDVRLDTSEGALAKLRQDAQAGRMEDVVGALTQLGATEDAATSAAAALSAPQTAGVLSVFYCGGNAVQDVEAYSLLTNERGQSWLVFLPASTEGPIVLERSSVAALAARVSVAIAARFARQQ